MRARRVTRDKTAVVFMVVVTTMATPPLLLWSLKRDGAAAPA